MHMLTSDDVKKARRQATAALGQARQPLYAMLGAGELAGEAVRDYVAKARTEAGDQGKEAQSRIADLQIRLVEFQSRLGKVRSQVRARVGELPEGVAGLRGKLETGELRDALENYFHSLQDLYERLATRGETTVDKLRHRPQSSKVTDVTEERAGTPVGEAGTQV